MNSYRKRIVKKIDKINEFKNNYNIMEVCGTHTMAISKFGLRNVLNDGINLISGPGCPVCVTPEMYMDYIYDLSLREDIIIATYGDMIRVPGSRHYITLEKSKAKGAQVNMVYSSIDALEIAAANKDKKVVFLGIGFETTTPATAIAVKEAEKRNIDNFYVLSMHKIIEPAMRALLNDSEINIDGFICPGHVAAILGVEGFEFLNKYNCSGVVTGFEIEDILDGLLLLLNCIDNKDYGIKNAYTRLIDYKGNEVALSLINSVFEKKDDYWRGIGKIELSGLKLRYEYKRFDIEELYPLKGYERDKETNGCRCGDVLKGIIKPNECGLFGRICTPENPIGPCMVSSEGSCAAYYKYNFI
ncbi:hydrogenase expression/formation protein HypD [Clostridium tepidiprofundi DSM 19306]|uniref:Hydrogenase expression/formation protein HypD n=1 Tax=Clostridium tepidiprofundi DSM 19306 TaxID=1121338 RepID=A0A151B6R9_9CLOT|nr:hydrogenase formation protein HypD [Clostridium tepidiprofundi]KYH35628.1 hydrogenase expression/formation protein HypD [Clostridium tepidiprofundi DSM 19306]